MKDQRIFIIGGEGNFATFDRMLEHLNGLPEDKKYRVDVRPYRKNRSIEQNNYLHAVPLKIICDHTGYDVEEMKHYLCGQAFGWEEFEVMDLKKKRPRKTTSTMTAEEFSWFIEWIAAWAAATLEIAIPMPNKEGF